MYNLKIIIASTRPGRKGPLVADWVAEIAKSHPEFNVEVLDLAVVNLPFFDEPNHPRLKQYTHQHTLDWSAKIEASDAFIVVTPEYNFGFPATIKNAIDFLFQEWRHKPIAFVSYGGISAGLRGVQMLKQVVTTLEMFPITASVNIPFFARHIIDEKFVAAEDQQKMAGNMFKDLLKWTPVFKSVRDGVK
ncbi:MAG: NADPH-dependent oxidoreductase [Chitinophagaceae bacterium]|nr:MAG: NADPH-dependent oxidoreductase [Chitinophagaceae bacterium]